MKVICRTGADGCGWEGDVTDLDTVDNDDWVATKVCPKCGGLRWGAKMWYKKHKIEVKCDESDTV